MNRHEIERVSAVISYVEAHLQERLDLDTAARAACYSKFHLHRMFAGTAGMTLHDYVRRRRLTEAARMLVFSERPVLEIALLAGYESQQAFTSVFKAMYKRTPAEYRRDRFFYPLQLAFTPNEALSSQWEIAYAAPSDIPGWMEFTALVIGGFPRLEERAHLERVRGYVQRRQAVMMRDGPVVVAAAACSRRAGSVDFLAVHPQYRRSGAAGALLAFVRREIFPGREISVTTFREGDKADTGQRAEYKRLGFAESELLTEFGYPTQRLILPPDRGAE